jgi:RHS repeat-associated protein
MALTEADGDVVNTYDYDVFGAVRASTGSEPNEFKFTGEQVDSSTGLDYLRARYYDQVIGRFISKHPMAARATWTKHAYAYSDSNPTGLRDPSGLDPDDERPPAVALPPPNNQNPECRDFWENDCHGIANEELRHYSLDAGKSLDWRRWGRAIATICNDVMQACLQQASPGTGKQFSERLVRDKMQGNLYGSSSLIPSLRNIRFPIPIPPITGDGGLIRNSKEGGPICVR